MVLTIRKSRKRRKEISKTGTKGKIMKGDILTQHSKKKMKPLPVPSPRGKGYCPNSRSREGKGLMVLRPEGPRRGVPPMVDTLIVD